MVMATDMAIHFDLLKRFNTQVAETPDITTWADPNLTFMMLLHLADIANPSRPFHLARGWAERVIQEFCEQVGIEHGVHFRFVRVPACMHACNLAIWYKALASHNAPLAQGDKETAGGLPISPFCVRATMDMPRAQLNFIEVFLRVSEQRAWQQHGHGPCMDSSALMLVVCAVC
jgi:hypothetical protein